MVRTAWSVLGRYGGSEAEDVVQEAFIAALTTPALPTGDVGAWLRAITVRKALDWMRRTRRRGEQSLSEVASTGPEPAAAGSPDGALDVLTVRNGLSRLSASDRAVLTLVDLEGRSMAEAAETLGLTRVAVRLRASRARRKLARLLRPERPEGASR
jgi:RNA polymerase sigma-70 factor (ECF subfamily)